MNEIVARVAVAIRAHLAKANEREPLSVDPDANGYIDLSEVDDVLIARAAINAMREYTPAMERAAYLTAASNECVAPGSAWDAMIQEVLGET